MPQPLTGRGSPQDSLSSVSGFGLDYTDNGKNKANDDNQPDNIDNGIHKRSPNSRTSATSRIKSLSQMFRPAHFAKHAEVRRPKVITSGLRSG